MSTSNEETQFICPKCLRSITVYHLYDHDAGEGAGAYCDDCKTQMEEKPYVPA